MGKEGEGVRIQICKIYQGGRYRLWIVAGNNRTMFTGESKYYYKYEAINAADKLSNQLGIPVEEGIY